MNSFNSSAHNLKSTKRKCLHVAICVVLFVLLISPTSCRPSNVRDKSQSQVPEQSLRVQNDNNVNTHIILVTQVKPSAFDDDRPVWSDNSNSQSVLKAAKSQALASSEIPTNHLSTCIWAVSSCCSNNRRKSVQYQCFERLGCHGSFWETDPCADNEFHDSAIKVADEYLV